MRHLWTLVPATIVAVFGVTTYASIARERFTLAEMEKAHETVDAYNILLSDIRMAYGGVRAFVVTGAESHLAPYTSALLKLPGDLSQVSVLVWAEHDEQRKFVVFSAGLRNVLVALDSIVRTRRTDGPGAMAQLGKVETLVSQTAQRVASGLAQERRELDGLRTSQVARAEMARIIIPLGALIATLLTVVFNVRMGRAGTRDTQRVRDLRELNSALLERQLDLEQSTVDLEEAAEALAQSEQRFSTIAQNSADLFYRVSFRPRLHFEFLSPALYTMTGLTPLECYRSATLFISSLHPDDRALIDLDTIDEAVRTGERIILRFLRGDQVIWTEHQLHAVRDESGQMIGADGVARDISLQRRHQAELEARESEFRALIENSAELVFVVDETGGTRFISSSVERVLGYSPQELLGTTMLDIVHADDLPTARAMRAKALRHEGERFEQTIRVCTKAGAVRTISYSAVSLMKHPGVRGIVINGRDITDVRRVEDQLVQSQKMEAIGRLAGGIAHDFNNLLTTIRGFTAFALRGVEDHEVRADLLEVDGAAERATMLTKQLLAFSRQQELNPTVVDVSSGVDGFLRMVRRVLREDITLLVDLPADSLFVMIDDSQLQQVLMNLFVNACDAMPDGGTLKISVGRAIRDSAWPDATGMKSGDYVIISVGDSGTGMSANVREHAFDPFFTTKGPGKGTGLGLSTVYGIISQSGGNIFLYSEIDLGTTFKIYLPLVVDGVAEGGPVPTFDPSGNETILVVEDEPAVRALAVRALKSCGYDVFEAPNGFAALSVLTSHPGIRLVVSDVVMPEMRGQELAARMAVDFPDVRLILMSGYLDTDLNNMPAHVPYIDKPFTVQSLTRVVRETLDKTHLHVGTIEPPGR